MKFSDVLKLTPSGNYRVNQNWDGLISALDRYQYETVCHLDLNPEFQRGHVWTEDQQIAYVEFKLRGGEGSNLILFNCPGWMRTFEGPFVLVDGKQRLNAVIRFLNNEIKVFGYYLKEFDDFFGYFDPDFIFCINNLPTMKDVYKWYIELNSGGTPHTKEEIDKVRKMLDNLEN